MYTFLIVYFIDTLSYEKCIVWTRLNIVKGICLDEAEQECIRKRTCAKKTFFKFVSVFAQSLDLKPYLLVFRKCAYNSHYYYYLCF